MKQKVDAFLMKRENITLTNHLEETLTMICLLLMNPVYYIHPYNLGNKYLITCYCTLEIIVVIIIMILK